MLSPRRFDFAVMDGNRDATYLRKETEIVRSILRLGSVLILDDVDDNEAGIKAEYLALGSRGWRPIDADGASGSFRLRPYDQRSMRVPKRDRRRASRNYPHFARFGRVGWAYQRMVLGRRLA
jgi:hypothetical protein